jgi:aspartate racemase
MEQAFYRDRLAAQGLSVLVPGAGDRAMVHSIIYQERARASPWTPPVTATARSWPGWPTPGPRASSWAELLVTQADSQLPVFPTARLHAQAAVEHALTRAGPRARIGGLGHR